MTAYLTSRGVTVVHRKRRTLLWMRANNLVHRAQEKQPTPTCARHRRPAAI